MDNAFGYGYNAWEEDCRPFSSRRVQVPPADQSKPPSIQPDCIRFGMMCFDVEKGRNPLVVPQQMRDALEAHNCLEWNAQAIPYFGWNVNVIYRGGTMQCTAGLRQLRDATIVLYQHTSGSIDVFNRIAHGVSARCDGVRNYPMK